MAIKIAPELHDHICEYSGGFTLQVQGVPNAGSTAADALRAAAVEIAALDGGWQSAPNLNPGDTNGPKWVGRVISSGTGPFVTIDGGATPDHLLLSIPEIVSRHLEAAGITKAVIGVPKDPPPLEFGEGERAVILRLYPPPPIAREDRSEVPDAWLSAAVEWLAGDGDDSSELWARIGSVGSQVGHSDALAFLEQARVDKPFSASLFAAGKGRGVNGCFGWRQPSLVLAGTAPGDAYADLELIAAQLREVADRLAPTLAYAFVAVEGQSEPLTGSYAAVPWCIEGGPQSGTALEELVDAFVLDAFPYQVLGKGHERRLGGMPKDAQPLEGGRFGLAIGNLSDWVPIAGDAGRDLLRPCFLSTGTGQATIDDRYSRWPAAAAEAEANPGAPLDEDRFEVLSQRLGLGRMLESFVERGLFQREQVPDLKESLRRRLGGVVPAEVPRFVEAAQVRARRWMASDVLGKLSRAVTLDVWSTPPPIRQATAQLPRHVIVEAATWLTERSGEVWAWSGPPHFAIPVGSKNVEKFLAWRSKTPRGGTVTVVTDPDRPIRALVVDFDQSAHLSAVEAQGLLDEFGPGVAPDEADLLTTVDGLVALARRVAGDVAYACMTLGYSDQRNRWRWRWGFQGDYYLVPQLCDEFVSDAFPYQILGPGHVARLGTRPPGTKALPGDRFEISVGKPEEWMPRAMDAGRRLLAPCLIIGERGDFGHGNARAVVGGLAKAGLSHVLDSVAATGGPLDGIEEVPNAVVLRLFALREGPQIVVPSEWTESIIDWLTADSGEGTLMAALNGAIQFDLDVAHAGLFLKLSREYFAMPATLAVGDVQHRVRAVCLKRGCLSLGVGGSDVDTAQLGAAAEQLIVVARTLSSRLGYAFMDFEPQLRPLTATLEFPPSTDSNRLEPAWDDAVLGGYPFQILGPGHLRRLPAPISGATELPEGRMELRVGPLGDWFRDSDRRQAVKQLAEAQLSALWPGRETARRASDDESGSP